MRVHSTSAGGSATAIVAFPPLTTAGHFAFLTVQLKQASGGSASPVAPEGWELQAEASGGSGAAGSASGTVAAAQYRRILDGTEGGTTVEVSANAAINCISACMDIFDDTIDSATVAGADNAPGAGWRTEFADALDMQDGDTVVVWSASNHQTGPNRSAHALQPAGLALASPTEFRDGGWNVGGGLGGSAVMFTVQTAPMAYTHTAASSSTNSQCGVSFVTRLRPP
jgi:hypothetical protein